jgi:hypothetical protein
MFRKMLSINALATVCFCSIVFAQTADKGTTSTLSDAKSINVVSDTHENTKPNQSRVLPARTSVRLTLINPVGSKTAISGEQFPLTVSEDIKVEGVVVIPQGTPAIGEVIHAQKAKGFGKAGELLVTVRHIDLNNTKIKMRSFQPLQGNNNTSTAMAVSSIPYVGVFAGFVQGDDIQMPAQTQVLAQTALEIIFPGNDQATENKASAIISNTNTTTGDSK